MKKIVTLTSILALSACGGGSGSRAPGVVISPDVDANIITGMLDSVNTESNIVAYATQQLGELIENSLEASVAEYKNLYDVATGDDFLSKDDKDLMNAYLLAGGGQGDYDWDNLTQENKHDIHDFVFSNHEKILKWLFDWGNDNKPTWNPKKQNLSDMEFHAFGNREWVKDSYVKVLWDENGKITKINMNDPHDDLDYDIIIDKTGKGVSTANYTYSVPVSMSGAYRNISTIDLQSDKELEISEIKAGLKNVLDSYENMSDEQKNQIIAAIDKISEDNKRISSHYDGMKWFDKDDLGYWFIKKEFMDINNFVVYGKSVGLRYSDFGRISGTYHVGDLDIDRKYVFAGGYDIKQVDKNQIVSEMNFKGSAVGNVMYHRTSETENSIEHTYLDLESKDVNLNFNNGIETLTMKFPNWYDVEVVSGANGDGTITFSNGDRISDDKYKFGKSEYSLKGGKGIDGYSGWGTLEANYYGDGFNPTEVSGKVDFHQQKWEQDPETYQELYNEEKYFMSAFGGVAK